MGFEQSATGRQAGRQLRTVRNPKWERRGGGKRGRLVYERGRKKGRKKRKEGRIFIQREWSHVVVAHTVF